MELYDYQEKAVSEMKNGCILVADPGAGKTFTAIHYYLRNEAPKNVYVITTARKRDELDWQAEFRQVGISDDPETTFGSLLTVDSWNNIGKYEEVENAFFIFDEQRLVGTGAWVKSYYKIAAANRWVMLSGTPGDTWLDYVPVFRANGFIKNITQFRNDHVNYASYSKFPKVVGYRNVGRLVRWRNSITVHMHAERHTVRVLEEVRVTYDKVLLRKVVKERWHVYENRPLRDVAELFSVMRRVVYSDATRLQAVVSLLERHPKLIVFYNFDYELEILRTLNIPQTQIMKTPDAIVKLGPSTQSTWNDSIEPWDYLLSSPSTSSGSCGTQSKGKSEISMATASGSNGTSTTTSHSTQQTGCVSTPITVAEWNGHKHEPIPKTDSWVYLVQYMAGSEAWNCIETDAMCLYSMTYSYKMWYQAFGRIDRINTIFAKLLYFILVSDAPIDEAVSKSLRAKKTFNEKEFGKSWQEIQGVYG